MKGEQVVRGWAGHKRKIPERDPPHQDENGKVGDGEEVLGPVAEQEEEEEMGEDEEEVQENRLRWGLGLGECSSPRREGKREAYLVRMEADIVVLDFKDKQQGRSERTEGIACGRLPVVPVQGRLEAAANGASAERTARDGSVARLAVVGAGSESAAAAVGVGRCGCARVVRTGRAGRQGPGAFARQRRRWSPAR